MKNLALIAAFLFVTTIGYAQSVNYHEATQKGIGMLDTAKTQSGYLATTSYFENLATTNDKEWLAQYYAAYSNLLQGIRGKADEETKDEIYDNALRYINKADLLNPNNSEIYVVKGYITFMKMAVYPTKRAMNMIPEANRLLEKAIALNAENPRAYLLKGQNTFYTPEMFGGGKEDAKPFLVTARQKFEKFTAKSLEPNWGKTRCEELLKEY